MSNHTEITSTQNYCLVIEFDHSADNPRNNANLGTIIAFDDDLYQAISLEACPNTDESADDWITWLGIDKVAFEEAPDEKKARMEQAAFKRAQKKYPVLFFLTNDGTCPGYRITYYLSEEKPDDHICGVVIVSRETLLEENPQHKVITQKMLDGAKLSVQAEFKSFVEWREGDVFTFVLHEEDGEENIAHHYSGINTDTREEIQQALDNEDASTLAGVIHDLDTDLSQYSVREVCPGTYAILHPDNCIEEHTS